MRLKIHKITVRNISFIAKILAVIPNREIRWLTLYKGNRNRCIKVRAGLKKGHDWEHREGVIGRDSHLLRSDFAVHCCVGMTKPPVLPARYPSRYVFSRDSEVVLRSRRRCFAPRCTAACRAIIRSVEAKATAVARSKCKLVYKSRGFVFPIRPIASINVGFGAFVTGTCDLICHETVARNDRDFQLL